MIKVKRLRPGAKMPIFATEGSAGADLYACIESSIYVRAFEIKAIPTGIAIEPPPYVFSTIRPRSGLTRDGLIVQLGTIDNDYRGELIVQALYIPRDVTDGETLLGEAVFRIDSGDRIAQLIIQGGSRSGFKEVEELSETGRGDGGFGSTGR